MPIAINTSGRARLSGLLFPDHSVAPRRGRTQPAHAVHPFGADLYCRHEAFGADRYCHQEPFGGDFYVNADSDLL
jgi:hypothetical protein